MARQAVVISVDVLAERGVAAIQDAIDAAARRDGGTVELPKCDLVLSGPIRLHTGVSLLGQGSGTVLRKAPSVSSPLGDWVGYGHFEVTVEDPDLFEPGMGVAVRDGQSFGFYETTATITGKDGNALFLDTALHHDYVPAHDGRVVSVFPMICADGAADIAVAHITVDGGNDPEHLGGCRGGGIHLLRTHGAVIQDVQVTRYNGDALSFQQCTDVVVRECELHHNSGGGLHPGSGSVRYHLLGNSVYENGGDGIFYCLRTTHSDCKTNTIRDNGGAGISIGERDTDHAIAANHISGNAGPGLAFRPVQYHGGDRVAITDNEFAENGGEAEIVIARGISDVTIAGNRFQRPAGKAVAVGEAAERIHIGANVLNCRELGPEGVSDPMGRASWEGSLGLASGGADAADPADARHLAYDLPEDQPHGLCAGDGEPSGG